MFSQASVILSGGGGCVYGEGRHAWRRGVCVVKEVCMAKGKMCGEGACMERRVWMAGCAEKPFMEANHGLIRMGGGYAW